MIKGTLIVIIAALIGVIIEKKSFYHSLNGYVIYSRRIVS